MATLLHTRFHGRIFPIGILFGVIFATSGLNPVNSAEIWWEFVGPAGDRSNYLRYEELVDFSYTSAHALENYPTWNPPSGHQGVKYQDILIKAPPNVCLDIHTLPGYMYVSGSSGPLYNPDTQIWYESPNGWVSANDDTSPGVYNSWVRIWTGTLQRSYRRFRIASYSASSNNIVFDIWARVGEADGNADCHITGLQNKYGYIQF